ncbi:MAG: cytochrome c assembly protein [Phycisphaerales bacterium]|nr:cytochrome c assembly protein [Phycisphaerales bacterium]
MADLPTIVQLLLVAAAAALIAAGTVLSARGRRGTSVFPAVGLGLALAAQLLHSGDRHDWLPLQDNFDALLWLAILVGGVTLYLRHRGTVPKVDLVTGPIVMVLLIAAAVFGRARPHEYKDTLWDWTHRLSTYASPVAFALAASAGVLYLVLRSKLRQKPHGPPDASYGSLERLERLNYTAVTIGFALLTVGLITGVFLVLSRDTTLGSHWFWKPKVLLSFGAYAVYALVLHSPYNPALRGKQTAILSIFGFVLLLGTLAVVQAMR